MSAIESAVIVVTSYLLTVCVVKYQSAELFTRELLSIYIGDLCKNYCFLSLCYVLSCIFVNKPSFSIILRVGLSTPYTHGNTFATISRKRRRTFSWSEGNKREKGESLFSDPVGSSGVGMAASQRPLSSSAWLRLGRSLYAQTFYSAV
ncbi:hypothetical protein AVEN_5522-1 [Araneus ventricosus]|uniref:Uncharacterized protein n=1 Tax=Araneus ventricosus TaxID=182803 RepID=A0A4Y2IWH4_ARAVE|nr:hypothetical protein AVEN_5522-1 [Araneus ventricosus]